jgi:hypothetical protein
MNFESEDCAFPLRLKPVVFGTGTGALAQLPVLFYNAPTGCVRTAVIKWLLTRPKRKVER